MGAPSAWERSRPPRGWAETQAGTGNPLPELQIACLPRRSKIVADLAASKQPVIAAAIHDMAAGKATRLS